MGFLARPGFSIFLPFFHGYYPWAETIPQCIDYTADIFSVPFRLSFSEGKREKNPRKSGKETVAPADCCRWENLKISHKYRDLAEEQPKKKERTDGRERTERGPENSIENKNGFPHSRFILRKEKEEEKKKGCWKREREGGENAERIGYCPEDLQASERSILRIKNFVPNGENKGNNDCLLT